MKKYINISDVLWFQEGPGVRNTQYTTDGVKLLNVTNLINGNVDTTNTNRYISKEEAYGKYKHFLADEGDLVIASSGIKVEYFDKKMGFIRKEQLPLCMNTSTIRFKVTDEKRLSIRYFMYYLKSNHFKEQLGQQITGSAQLNFGPSHLKKMVFPLIEMEEQAKIIDKLDTIYGIEYKMRTELKLYDQLVRSLFIEMFGDPVENPKKWDISTLLTLGSCKNGMNFHIDDFGVEINCIGVGDFKDHDVISNTYSLPIVSLNSMPTEDYLLKDEDIVFVRSNGNKTMVGRSIVIYPGENLVTFSGFCIRYRNEDSSIMVPYLLRVLKTESIRMQMYGRGANIQNLNQKILASLKIPIPPMNLQEKFIQSVSSIDKSKFASFSHLSA
jgi:restriction modification system DNA specificity domain protein